jgi:NO-binding membrane sensor protein with MHYT domain
MQLSMTPVGVWFLLASSPETVSIAAASVFMIFSLVSLHMSALRALLFHFLSGKTDPEQLCVWNEQGQPPACRTCPRGGDR